jgi:ParB family chromosome partitioning protein
MLTLFQTQNKPMVMLSPHLILPNPYQPRTHFGDDELTELCDSIRRNGLVQPLTVRKTDSGSYQLIAGERRLRAAKKLNMQKIPCYIIEADDYKASVLSLIENLQREDLSFFEEAEGIRALMHRFGLTQHEAAEKLGKSQSAVANKLRLLRLSRSQRERIENLGLTERHARALLRLPDEQTRDCALNEIILKGYNVSQTEQFIDKMLAPPKAPARKNFAIGDIRLFVNSISHAVEMMRSSGVNAQTSRVDTEDYIQYTVIIPK